MNCLEGRSAEKRVSVSFYTNQREINREKKFFVFLKQTVEVMIYPELCPAYADFSSFLEKNAGWQKLSLLPWNALVDNRTFLAVESNTSQAGWGKPFDVKKRPSAAQALTVVKYYFTPVLVTMPEKDQDFLMFHRNLSSVEQLYKAIESYIRFRWPNYTKERKLTWFFPQLSKLDQANMPDLRMIQNLTVNQLCDRYAEKEVAFPSFRVEVKKGPAVLDSRKAKLKEDQSNAMNRVAFAFRQLEQNGKLACPSPPFLGLLSTNMAPKLVKVWDEFALEPRRPAQELELPLLEIFNTRAIDPALSKFDKIPSDQKTPELLQTTLAAALLETVELPFGPITTIKKLAETLQQQGNIKRDSSRAFLQQEAGQLLRSSEIGISHGDPWFELSKLARFVVERMWLWVKALNARNEMVPHDLLPFRFVRHFGELNLQPRRPEQPAFQSPPGLYMAGKIVRNRTLICVSVAPLEFVSVASNIQAEDFPSLVETFSTILETFAWDDEASVALQIVLKSIEEGQTAVAIDQWKIFVEATKSMPRAKGSTSTLVVSKLATNFVANSAARNMGDLLLKTNENRDNQAIIRFWRHRFGKRRVNVFPRKLGDIPTPAKTANRRLLICPPKNMANEPIFKKREPQTYCAVINCCTPLEDLFICPLHHRALVDKLQENKLGTIAPPDFADVSGAKRVWAAEHMKEQTPLNLNRNQARAKFHLESIALHNPDVRMELPAAQLSSTAMNYHSAGVDVEWGSRSFWKNEGLLRALHTLQCEFVSAQFDLKVLPEAKKPDRMVVPPMGDKLEWTVLPGHIVPRNDPEAEENRGKDEDGLVWETLVLKKDFTPSLGHYSSVGTQKDGTSILFEISETAAGTRKVSSPILAIVKDYKTYCVDPLDERQACPRECRRIFDELGRCVNKQQEKSRWARSLPFPNSPR
ncbi:unnamed protein product [Oikopleura dioica]|uniref:Uncharacterized protein n=1 Tax=Oikopleura dioica TaxID=34765 RepID=E4X2B9_OIKDI|nr:unnamed protein product [Oikopleura dioica]